MRKFTHAQDADYCYTMVLVIRSCILAPCVKKIIAILIPDPGKYLANALVRLLRKATPKNLYHSQQKT